jgi:hypothetical protein
MFAGAGLAVNGQDEVPSGGPETQLSVRTSLASARIGGRLAAYLARYKCLSRLYTNPDLRMFLRWCVNQLDP